jgi:cytochrome c553|tara:strand:- start:96189 stop:96500 length:312 start_codon:yes stop_codon:yes gene_type:complete
VKLLTLTLITAFISITSQNIMAQDAKRGATLYKTCVQCHGEDGMGDPSQQAPKIAGQYDWYIISTIKLFKEGTDRKNPKMLPFIKDLSDQDIADLAAYVSQMK